MLNEDRIKLMTKMAAYEMKQGKKEIPISKYYRIDYITYHMLKTAVSITIAFCLFVGMRGVYKADYFMENIHKINLILLGKSFFKYYAIFMLVYMILAYFVYMIKYSHARHGVKRYYGQLKRLSKLYEKDDNKDSSRKSLGGRTDNDHITRI
ncbi:hypothetical protein CG709_18640 [Lachnotalea glycerini]|nr:hypothetical protein CG709_18640 [Lachnotalea glycerini]